MHQVPHKKHSTENIGNLASGSHQLHREQDLVQKKVRVLTSPIDFFEK